MKKIFAIVATMMLVTPLLFLTGCGGNSSPNVTADDFRLTISVSATEFNVGTDIEVTATFENLSGYELKITRDIRLVWLTVVDCTLIHTDEAHPRIEDTLKNGEVRNETRSFGNHLQRGKHELFAYAEFSILNGDSIRVHSDTISIVVN